MTGALVSVVIVNWNRVDAVLTVLRHLDREEYPALEIIVVDNGSTDESVEKLRKVPSIRVIQLEKNHGPCRARNVGMQAARGDYILLLDSDVRFDGRGLTKLVERMESDPTIGIAGFKILNYYSRKIDQWIYSQPCCSNHNREFDTYSFSAAGALLRSEAIRKAGHFWEKLFIHNEEVDLSIRVIRSGYRVIYYPRILVYHCREAKGRVPSSAHAFFQIRNWIWIFYRYHPVWSRYTKIATYILVYVVKGLLSLRVRSCVSGIVAGLKGVDIIDEFKEKLTRREVSILNRLNRRWWIRLRP